MKKETITKALEKTPLSAIITCRPEDERGNPKVELSIQYRYSKKAVPSNIPEERKKGLEALFYKNPRKAIDEIIQYRFLDREITGFYEGAASIILPTKYHQFYTRCTSFETSGYQVYFNDFAIPVFKSTILKLDERSKRDSFQFLKRKIENGDSQHLHLSLSEGYANTRSRMCMQLKNKEKHAVDPENSLYYYINFREDGTLDEVDLENVLNLIEVFVRTYGRFGMVHTSDKGCVGYNVGSLKVSGIDKVPEMYQKVYSLRKREE